MIYGLGIDIVEIDRIRRAYEKNPRFPNRLLTAAEFERFTTLQPNRQVEYLASRFAAKEAYSKAFGTGIGSALSFLDIETAVNELGKPFFTKHPYDGTCFLTISHEKHYAVAQVILERS